MTLAALLFAVDPSSGASDRTPSRRVDRTATSPYTSGASATATRTEQDAHVVAAVRVGDMEAFESVFRGLYPPLVRFATTYTHDVSIAEEVVADVFAALWEQRASWTIRTTIEAYLFGVVRHRLTDRWRLARGRAAIETRYAADLHPLGGTERPIDETLDAEALDARIERAVDALPPRYRMVIVLRCHHEMSYEEVAEVLGVSTAAVHQQMSRAIRMLRIALGIVPSAKP